jgi:hypothetical protein
MKKQVIENFNEWIFEAEAAASGSPLMTVLKKVEGIFPKAAWYKKMENSDVNPSATDPEAVKAFKVVKRFFDPKAPELAANQGKDFFSYYEVKGQNAKDKNGGTGPVAAIHNDLRLTKDLYTALVPTLMTSGFPQTKAFKAAAEMAVRTNPEVSKLLALPTVKPHAETLYTELTKPA